MKQDPTFIQNFAAERELVVEQIDFRGEYAARFQVATLHNRAGERFVLKVLTSENLFDQRSFLVEESFLRLAAGSPVEGFVPRLIESESRQKPFWLLREYFVQSESGKITITFGFRSKFFALVPPKLLATFQLRLWQMGTLEGPRLSLPITRTAELAGYVSRITRPEKRFLGARLRQQMVERFEEHWSALNASFHVLAHNDLYPANILFAAELVKVIDWERCGYDYPLSDAVFLHILSWQQPQWQRQFQEEVKMAFKEFALQETGKDLSEIYPLYWAAMQLYWSTRLLAHARSMYRQAQRGGADPKIAQIASTFSDYLFSQIKAGLQQL